MKLFWYELSLKRNGSPLEVKKHPYDTTYLGFDGTIVDGKTIMRNNSMYHKMYRVNTDIRRAITEKQETSMKNGYEIRRYVENSQREKVIDAPLWSDAMEASWGINKIKNAIIKNLDLFGNVYIRKARNIRKGIAKYEVLDSRHVSIVTDSFLNPIRYQYKNPAKKGAIDTYPADEIFHYYDDTDMDNPMFGISPLETIVIDVLGDEEANMSNYAFFDNDGIPSSLFILKEGLTPEAQKQALENIREQLKWGSNKYKSLASTAILDIKQISQAHTDANFTKQREITTQKVSVALGVPRSIMWYIDDVNYSNGDTQYKKFIENTIRPLERRLAFIFETLLQWDFGEYKALTFNVIDEHIDDFEQRCKIARENVKNGMWTINEARLYIGYEAITNEMGNEVLVGSNTRLLDDLLLWTPTTATPTEPAISQ